MSYQANVYRVMIASPSDVETERKTIPNIIYKWNAINSFNQKVILLPIKWETHTIPQMGERPQAIINSQIVKDADILIALFWTKLGSPTGIADSGTIEEINEFISSKKPALLYFSSLPVVLDSVEPNQYAKLKEFKEKLYKEGLVSNYASIVELEDQIFRHLTTLVYNLENSKTERISVDKESDRTEGIMHLKQIMLNWNIERDSTKDIRVGKNILRDIRLAVIKYCTESNIDLKNDIERILINLRKLEEHRITLDGGESFKVFWQYGDHAISELNKLLEKT